MDSCSDSYFHRCNCCYGDGCASDVPSRNDAMFCGSTYVGQTGAQWGNPACKENNRDVLEAEWLYDTCVRSKFDDTIVSCDRRTCDSSDIFTNSTVTWDVNGCDNSDFVASAMACMNTGATKITCSS